MSVQTNQYFIYGIKLSKYKFDDFIEEKHYGKTYESLFRSFIPNCFDKINTPDNIVLIKELNEEYFILGKCLLCSTEGSMITGLIKCNNYLSPIEETKVKDIIKKYFNLSQGEYNYW